MPTAEVHATTTLQDTLVIVWRGEPDVARVDGVANELRIITQRNDDRVFLYNVVTAAMPLPQAKARAALQKHFDAMRGKLIAAAMVVEKTGVEGPLHRAVLSTLITITRQPFAMRVFSARDDGARWLNSQGCRPLASALVLRADALDRQLGT